MIVLRCKICNKEFTVKWRARNFRKTCGEYECKMKNYYNHNAAARAKQKLKRKEAMPQ